jgi:hypothetical protein
MYYNDGSFKVPKGNPHGSKRAGAGTVKLSIETLDGVQYVNHEHDVAMPVVVPESPKFLQGFSLGANGESNITAEWSACGYALMDVLWHLEQDENFDEKVDVEMRQGCYQVRDVLCSGGKITQNVVLIKRVMDLWKEVSAHDRVLNCTLYHVYSHGKGVVPDVWNEHADVVAKAAANGDISLVGKFAELSALHEAAKPQKGD